MKKLMALTSMLLVLVLLFSGYAIATEETLEPVELKVWMYGIQGQKDEAIAMEAFNALLSELVPNTTISLYIPADMGQEYNLAMAAGERIDMCWTGWTTDLTKEAKVGNLLPMDDLLAKYGQGIVDTLSEGVINLHRLSYDGKLYQVPTYQGLCGAVACVFPMEIVSLMRDGWIEEFDQICDELYWNFTIDGYAKQLDLVEEYCAAAKENGKLGNGINPSYLKSYCLGFPNKSGIYGNYFFDLRSDDDTFTATSNFDESSLYYQFIKMFYGRMADWYTKGYISADISTTFGENKVWEGEIKSDAFINGHVTYTSNLETALAEYAQKTKSDVIGFKVWRAWQSDLGIATGMSIPYTSKYPDRAMMLINAMYTNAELYNTWCFGKKDTHWKDNGDGSISLLHGYTGEPTSEWPYGQYSWTFGNKLLLYGFEKDWVNPISFDAAHLAIAYNSPLRGFSMDTSSVEDQYSNALMLYQEADQPLFLGIYGADWEGKFNTFMDEINAIGMDNLVDEFNAQIHKTLEAKGITSWKLVKEDYEQESSPAIAKYKPAE